MTSEVALAVFGFVAKWLFSDGADFTEVILVPAALFKIKVQAKHKPTGLFETISSVRGHATAVAGQCGLNSKSL